jgi:hypothetical protein
MAKRRRRTSTTNGLNGWGSAHAVSLLSSLSIFYTEVSSHTSKRRAEAVMLNDGRPNDICDATQRIDNKRGRRDGKAYPMRD